MGDIVLAAMVLWALALIGRRVDRMWALLGIAFLLFVVGDTAYVALAAGDGFTRGSLASTTYPIAMLLIGLAAQQRTVPEAATPTPPFFLLPAICGLSVIVVLELTDGSEVPVPATVFGIAALVLVVVRFAGSLREAQAFYEKRRFERGFEEAALAMALLSSDGRFLRVNAACERLLGRPVGTLVGASALDAVVPDARELARETLAAQEPREAELRMARADGAPIDVLVRAAPVVEEHTGAFVFAQLEDVTGPRRAGRERAAIARLGRRALDGAQPNELLEEAVTAVAEALAVRDSVIVRDGRPACTAGERPLLDGTLVAAQVAVAGRAPVSRRDADGHYLAVPLEFRSASPWALAIAAPSELDAPTLTFLESVAHWLASAAVRAQADAELRRLALSDTVTGLPNRAFLTGHLEQALRAAGEHDRQVVVLALGIDRFKAINETLGHTVGDALLQAAGERIRGLLTGDDLLARLGGDEFVVVCEGLETDTEAAQLAGRLVDAFGQPVDCGEEEPVFVSVSIGVALGGAGADAATLLRDADVAMVRAKQSGGGRAQHFDVAMQQRLVEHMALERELRRSVERNELVLHYQPIADLDTGRLHGLEALVRWQHPERGLLGPGAFIEVAEESDVIVEIGRWVLDAAVRQAAVWCTGLRLDGATVSVNLSARQVRPALVGEVAGVLARHALAPRHLCLEITETLLLQGPAAIDTMAQLRELGVQVALDDFGTGYSSLGYLHRFPVGVLKLDRAFVDLLEGPGPGVAIAEAAIAMGRALHLDVVAEGIERSSQRARLLALGCHAGQGFLLSRPVDAETAGALLADRDRLSWSQEPAAVPAAARPGGSVG
jgi:diguanylate cyclase (GGDEF)-like protein/PAS domain S-box-containing protein